MNSDGFFVLEFLETFQIFGYFLDFWKNYNFSVRSCLLITLIKCLKRHKSLGSLFKGVLLMYLSFSLSLSLFLSLSLCFFGQVKSPHHSDQMSQRSQVSRVTL